MNHHYRSHSEQPHQAVPPVGHQPTVESYITIHSDSQQSLDRLFNPSTTAVPLRGRNLPRSFFEPGHKIDENGGTNGNGVESNHPNLHHRSISYGFGTANGPAPNAPRRNFHVRTHATALAPMSTLPASNHSSFQSSQEVLNTESSISTNNNHSDVNSWINSGSQQTSSIEDSDITSNGGIVDATPIPPLHNQQLPLQQHHTPPARTLNPANQHFFFNQAPQVAEPIQNNGSFASPNVVAGSVHTRSMSYDQRPSHARPIVNHHNLHSRTHSTLAPMSVIPSTNQIQNNSSQEFLNYPYNNHQSATGWSSSGYSSDDMTSAVNNWAASQPMAPQPAHTTLQPQQIIAQPSGSTLLTQPTDIATSVAQPAAQAHVFYQI